MNKIVLPPEPANPVNWPEGLTRVPYWVFQNQSVYAEEQRKIFQGPNWHYLALEIELAEPGDFLTTHIGDTPVIVTRGHRQ
ncbi:phenylpropionate dioxygenase-like ring-hydroxylating dioxygenase large terminal subunit [Bradyrhizobium sp. LM3.6]